jgi:hypothetical protein
MRLFQNSGLTPSYKRRLRNLTKDAGSFDQQIDIFLNDRFGAPHWLEPVIQRREEAFIANGDESSSQRRWAVEHGLRGTMDLEDILLAQIENHRADVFYNQDPMRYGSNFVRKLPGCVKRTIAWRAAPSPGADFGAYDLVVCNFPSILEGYRRAGWRAAYFSPAHDPVLDRYAVNSDRPIDVLFVGGYSRHHRRRAELLEAVADLRSVHAVAMHLDRSRLTRWAESPLGRLLPLGSHRRPTSIQLASLPPIYGLDLYAALSRAKVVINGAIDMAGAERGNMRCFEALGCRCALLSDAGTYPAGMVDGETLRTYASVSEAISLIKELLTSNPEREALAAAGREMVATRYSKSIQWNAFQALAA